jgi:transcription elongation factor Elf1
VALTADELSRALALIARRQADFEAVLDCPRCGQGGLVLTDRSARPYAEWYHLSCSACGMNETIHIPLGPPVAGGYD